MRLSYPLIIVNFKTYLESLGKRAVELARKAESVAQETGVCIAVAPQAVDLARVAGSVEIPVFAQHVDADEPGAHTGAITAESLKEAGAAGSLLNHSERRIRVDLIEEAVRRCASLGLITCVCANTPLSGRAVAGLRPDIVAIEPPELIGSGISVSRARPEIVSDSVSLIRECSSGIRVLCGAGITSGEDVSAALRLGAEGVLVASGIVRAKDPSEALYGLAKGALRNAEYK